PATSTLSLHDALPISENARTSTARASSSAIQNEAIGAPISSAAARAISDSTCSMWSDEDTTWFTRASARSRAARSSSASRSRARSEEHTSELQSLAYL